jgi:hypothetical protein
MITKRVTIKKAFGPRKIADVKKAITIRLADPLIALGLRKKPKF